MSEELERKTLRTEGLVKIYGKRTVVNDVSFTVTQGEIVGLLGPNGAGKTTSFYMTTGLVVPKCRSCVYRQYRDYEHAGL